MIAKRIIVLVLSLVLGAVLTAVIVSLLLGTTIAEFGTLYFSLTSFFFGCAFGIWLDKFLGTELLPE